MLYVDCTTIFFFLAGGKIIFSIYLGSSRGCETEDVEAGGGRGNKTEGLGNGEASCDRMELFTGTSAPLTRVKNNACAHVYLRVGTNARRASAAASCERARALNRTLSRFAAGCVFLKHFSKVSGHVVADAAASTLTTAQRGPSGSRGARWLRGTAAGSAPSCGTPPRGRPGERGAETRGSSAPPGNIHDPGPAGARLAGQAEERRPGAWQGERDSLETRRAEEEPGDVHAEAPAVVLRRQRLHGGGSG